MKKMLQLNGHRLYVERHGSEEKPPLVLLHHGLGAVRSWRKQIPALTEAGFQVIAYDRWGHGKSEAREVYAMPHFEPDLADLEVLLQGLNVERAALIGHSDGGKIAMYFTARNPARVTSLVIVSAHVFIERDMAPGIESVRRDFEDDRRFQEKMKRVHGDKAESLFWGWYHGWTRAEILDWDLRPTVRGISCQTLVVQGLEDEHISPAQGRQLAKTIPGAELWLVPNAGHMLPQDWPEAFNQRLLDFLSKEYSVMSAKPNA